MPAIGRVSTGGRSSITPATNE